MSATLRAAVVPAYLLLCIVLGGSAQGVWGNLALQLFAVAILAWTILAPQPMRVPPAAKALFAIAGLAVLLIIIQLIPLPPSLWAAIPGREYIAEGYALLGQPMPWLPISLTPYDTMAAALMALPPLAVLAGMLVAGAYRSSWLAAAVLLGTFAAVLLGALQVASPEPAQSPWYLYRRTNFGVATGFFANSNHMATLLVVSLAFLIALYAQLRERARNAKAGSAAVLIPVGGSLVLLVGIVLNGSLAALLLGVPVLLLSAAMLIPRAKLPRGAVVAVAVVSVFGVVAVYMTPLQDRLIASNSTSFESRQRIWSTTIPAIADNWALGSGIASFPEVYPRYEDPSAVTRTYANHAHNDYLEIAVDAGVPGILLVVAFLLWWGSRTVAVWRSAAVDRYAQAAAIATAAMLVHSFVDFPLRTASLSAIMAACLALMAQPRTRESDELEDLWPTRHLAV
jgi:O-antigen ligase